MAKSLLRLACSSALLLLGCRREATEQPSPRLEQPAAAQPIASRVPGPAALREALGIPADAAYETATGKLTPAVTPRLKTQGTLGEWLEGDVFLFKADSVRTCSEGKGGASVLGAEVQIRARSRLTFSPRELRLVSGGVVYHASLDPERESKACAPLLKVAWLKKDELIRGFVLFDVPPPRPRELTLHYQPTRWGGAGHVRVTLANTQR